MKDGNDEKLTNEENQIIEEVDTTLLLNKAWALRGQGQYGEARELLETIVDNCPEDSYEVLGQTYHIYRQLAYDKNKINKALKYSNISIDYYSKTSNHTRLAHAIRHRADIFRKMGELELASSDYESALKLYRTHGSEQHLDLANLLRGLALLREAQGNITAAMEIWTEVAEVYGICGLEDGVKEAKWNLDRLEM